MTQECKTGKRRAVQAISAGAFLIFAAVLLAFSEDVKTGIRDSLPYCLTVLVPSLFPFMALTSFAVDSGAGETIGKYLGWALRYVFRLPSFCTAAVLMSLIGGYPAGAKGVSLLLEQGRLDRKQAGRMMLFCINPGPAFVVTFLGGSVLHSFRAGWLLFFSVTAASILLGIITGLGKTVPPKEKPQNRISPAGAVTRSATDASKSVLTMCACIVLFSGFTSVLRSSGVYSLCCRALAGTFPLSQENAAALLSFLMEVTGGVGDAAKFQAGAVLYAFGLAFGGLCVHLQVFAFFGRFPLPKWKFFLSRLIHGLLSAGFCALALKLFPQFRGAPLPAVFMGNIRKISPLSGTLAGGLSLLLMCMAFLLATTKAAPDRSSAL